MASSSPDVGSGLVPATETTQQEASSTTGRPVEMSELSGSPRTVNEEEFKDAVQTQPAPSSAEPPLTTAAQPMTTTSQPTGPQEEPRIQRSQTSEALGPATDAPTTTANGPPSGPTLNITLMLTTGARHPYKIDEKYLSSRKVEARNSSTGAFDPLQISGYQLKELVWIDWRNEWEARPSSPSSIRLIILGRLIEDKTALKDFPFNMDAPNVVHMTVKPADLIDDEETAAKGTGKGGTLRQREGEDRGAGCRCVIL